MATSMHVSMILFTDKQTAKTKFWNDNQLWFIVELYKILRPYSEQNLVVILYNTGFFIL